MGDGHRWGGGGEEGVEWSVVIMDGYITPTANQLNPYFLLALFYLAVFPPSDPISPRTPTHFPSHGLRGETLYAILKSAGFLNV